MLLSRHCGGLRTAATAAVFALGAAPAGALDRGKPLTQYVLDAWGTRDGLQQHRVQAITQSADGYLWLATENGLVRFDGARFTTFNSRSTPGFGHDYIYALAADTDGLWIGTYHGLTRMQGGRFTTYTERDGMADAYVWVLAPAVGGGFWAGGFKGLTRYQDGKFSIHPSFKARAIRAVLQTKDGVLWVVSGRKLHRVVGDEVTVLTARDGLHADLNVNGVIEGSDGALWLATGEGLGRCVKGACRFWTVRDGLPTNTIRTVHEDAQGHMWLGTTAGLVRFDGRRFETLTRGLTDDAVISLAVDREGSLWVGTPKGGLNRLRDGSFVTFGKPEGLSEYEVWTAIESKDGSIWIGTQVGGLNRMKDGRIKVYNMRTGFPDDTVFTAWEGRGGVIWFGTNGGLVRFENERVQTYGVAAGLQPPSVRAVLEDSKGRVWAGTSTGGLYRKDGERFVAARPPGVEPGAIYVSAMLETRDGSLWIGTDAGLWRLQGDEFTAYTTREGLPGNYAASLLEDDDGSLWVGMNPGGVGRLKDGKWAFLGPESGLLDERADGMVDDGLGRIWFSAARGIFFVPKSELRAVADGRQKTVASHGFNAHDGLRVPENASGFPNMFRARDGRLWIATSAGVGVVDPGELRRNPVPPPVYLEDVTADGARVARTQAVSIPPGRGELVFQYTALSLRVPERVRFKYRLEGFDTDWVDAGGRRTAFYTNIPPGPYVFRVVASNDDGVWNEAGASLQFELLPHFYQTRWFLALCVALLGAAILAAHRVRVRRLKAREVELARRVDEAVAQIKVLNGLLPICASCKKIRDDSGYWNGLENYIEAHSHAEFSHGICPDCMKKLYPDYTAGSERPRRAGA